MAEFLPPVSVRLGADIAGLKKGMSEAKKEMGDVAKEGHSSFSKLAVGVAGGVAAAGAAAVAFGAKSIGAFEDVAGEIAKMQRLTGGTAEDMSKLRFAAEESGVSAEVLSKSMLKLSKATAGQGKALHAAGIAYEDSKGKMLPMKEVMENAADVFAKMPNGIEKNRLAMQLFGKAGTELIPMLNKGKKGLEELGGEADKYGLVLGQKDVDAFKKNKQAHREMHAAWTGLQVQIGKVLMPVLAKVTTMFAKVLPVAIALVKQAMTYLQPVITWLSDEFGKLVLYIQAHWDQIKLVVSIAIEYVKQIIRTGVEIVLALWAKFGSNIMDYLKHVWTFVQTFVKAAIQVVAGVIEVVTNLIHGRWGKVWEGIKKIFTGVWDAIKGYLVLVLDEIKNILEIVWKSIGGLLGKAWDGIKSAANTVWNGIKTVVLTPVHLIQTGIRDLIAVAGAIWDGIEATASRIWSNVKETVRRMISDIKGIISGVWDGLKSGFTIALNWVIDHLNSMIHMANKIPFVNIPDIPKLATGGRVTESGLVTVGERGREVVALPKGAQVFPNGSSAEQGAGGSGVNVPIIINGVTDHHALARAIGREVGWQLRVA